MSDNLIKELDPISELPSLIWPMTDTLRMEAAMCLWEAALEEWGYASYHAESGTVAAYLETVGAVEARHSIMSLVEPLHIGWHVHELAAPWNTKAPFDWDFTPWFLRNCVDVTSRTISLKPNWLDLCREARGEG